MKKDRKPNQTDFKRLAEEYQVLDARFAVEQAINTHLNSSLATYKATTADLSSTHSLSWPQGICFC